MNIVVAIDWAPSGSKGRSWYCIDDIGGSVSTFYGIDGLHSHLPVNVKHRQIRGLLRIRRLPALRDEVVLQWRSKSREKL